MIKELSFSRQINELVMLQNLCHLLLLPNMIIFVFDAFGKLVHRKKYFN